MAPDAARHRRLQGPPPARLLSGGALPEVWVVRHGATAWSTTHQHTGRTDLPLLAEGEDQARALAPRLADGGPFDLVLTSPLRRAADTARLAGLDAEPEPQAMEWDYGPYEGRTTAEIRETQPGWEVWTADMGAGESLAAVAARADAVGERLRGASGVRRAVLVSHGHFLRVFVARWLGLAPGDGRRFLLPPAGVGVLGDERGHAALARWG